MKRADAVITHTTPTLYFVNYSGSRNQSTRKRLPVKILKRRK